MMHLFPRIALPDPSQLGRALIDILVDRSGNKRLALIVDDLQHSDPGTASVTFGRAAAAAQLAAAGATSKEIAEKRFVSARTIDINCGRSTKSSALAVAQS